MKGHRACASAARRVLPPLSTLLAIAAGLGSGCLDPEPSRFRPNGVLDWAFSFGGPGDDLATSLQSLDDGGFLVAGIHGGAEVFDGFPFPEAGGGPGGFVARLDLDRQALWVVDIRSGTGTAAVESVALDADGNVAATGWSGGGFSVRDGLGTTTALPTEGDIHAEGFNIAFVLRIDGQSGALLDEQARFASSSQGLWFLDGDLSPDGLLVTGGGTGNLLFGEEGSSTSFAVSAAGCGDSILGAGLFVAAWDWGSGDLAWVTVGEGCARGTAVAARGDSGLAVTGLFQGTLTLPGSGGTPVVLDPADSDGDDTDAFVALLDAATGEAEWAVRIGGESADYGLAAAITAGNTVVVAGAFNGSADVCDRSSCGTPIDSETANALFVAKYDGDGDLLWSTTADADVVGSIARCDILGTDDGGALVAGGFMGAAVFGPDEPNATELTTFGDTAHTDPFLARYDSDGRLLWVRAECGEDAFGTIGALSRVAEGTWLAAGRFEGEAVFGRWEPNQTTLVSEEGPAQAGDGFVLRLRDE